LSGLGHEFATGDLGRFDVGLVEGIQAEQGARDRDRDLPAKNFLDEIERVGDLDPNDRMARGFECFEPGVSIRGRSVARECDVDENAVVRVPRGIGEVFPRDRDDSLSVLAGRLTDQLRGRRGSFRDRRRD